MTTRSCIHWLLLAALYFGQLAASVHHIGHFHVDAHHHEGLDTAHVHFHSVNLQSQSGESDEDRDCSIYHTFQGLNGCLWFATTDWVTPRPRVAYVVANVDAHVTPRTHNVSIRGPPALS